MFNSQYVYLQQKNDQIMQSIIVIEQIPVHQLSGDQKGQKSFIFSIISVQTTTDSRFFFAVMALMKTVVGIGLLQFPLVMSRFGWLLTLLIMIIMFFLSYFGSNMLLFAKNLSRKSNYSTLAKNITNHKVISKMLQLTAYICILINNMGICVAEGVVIGNCITYILQKNGINDKDKLLLARYFFTLGVFIVLIPFILIKKFQKLKYLAFIGITCILIFVIIVITIFILRFSQLQYKQHLKPFPNKQFSLITLFSLMSVFPNLLLASFYQMNFFSIYKGMKKSNDIKMKKATFTAGIGIMIFYLTVGFFGFATFGQKLKSNYILSIPQQIPLFIRISINVIFILNILCTLPIMFFGSRNNFVAIINTIFPTQYQNKKEKIDSNYVQQKIDKKKRISLIKNAKFYIGTILLYLVIYGFCVSTQSLQIVINIIGSLASNSIGLIWPSFFVIAYTIRKKIKKSKMYYGACIIFICSFPLGVFSIVSLILNLEQH